MPLKLNPGVSVAKVFWGDAQHQARVLPRGAQYMAHRERNRQTGKPRAGSNSIARHFDVIWGHTSQALLPLVVA